MSVITNHDEDGIQRIKIPMDGRLEFTNVYLLSRQEEHWLVDTGIDEPGNFDRLTEALATFGLSWPDIDAVFLTHLHPDHIGLVLQAYEANPELKILCADEGLGGQRRLEDVDRWVKAVGLQIDISEDARIVDHPFLDFQSQVLSINQPVSGGDQLTIGDLQISVIGTPGHTPGHLCLYIPSSSSLFTGDHLLPNETPNVGLFPGQSGNPLGDYRQSLAKLRKLTPVTVYPGHGEPFTELDERLDVLEHHHDQRLAEVRSAVEAGASTVVEIAMNVSWVEGTVPFQQLDEQNQFLALAETLSHLIYLEAEAHLQSHKRDGVLHYQPVPSEENTNRKVSR